MAFVSNSSRKISQFTINPQFPSPAHYQLKQGETNHHQCAPFRSTSLRKVDFIQHQSVLPGPGQYQISKQIIKPKISAYVNNDSIVIKINSTGSPEFKSDTIRFKNEAFPKHDLSLLAQQFEEQTIKETVNNQPAKKTDRLKIHKLPQIQRNQVASIPSKSRILMQEQSNDQPFIETKEQLTPGPGFYQSMISKHINSKGAVWGRDATKRFINFSTIQVGPGQYSIVNTTQLKNGKEQSANFKSGTVRSFFDEIMYHSSVEDVVNQRQKQNFKSPEPAPGQYNYPESFKKINKNMSPFQYFGSSVDRFITKQTKSKPHHQFYNVGQYFGSNNSFNKVKCAFNSQTQRNPSFLASALNSQTPGPGKYHEQNRLLKRKKGKNIQMFGSVTERSKQLTKEKQASLSNEVNQSNEVDLLKNRFNQLQNESCAFKSNTSRQCFGTIKSETKLGQYDLSYNDVSKKLERQRICIQNLKKIQIVKPPFESNKPRFAHYQSIMANNCKSPQYSQTIRKQSSEKQAKYLSIGGKIGKQKRFAKQKRGKNGPGVGTYNYTVGWEKPSFNARFQQN